MNNRPDNNPGDDFVDRAGNVLNAQAEALDGATRSRLNRARQSALAALTPDKVSPGGRRNWMPAGSVALVALFVAVILVDGYQLGGSPAQTDAMRSGLIDPGLIATPVAVDLEVLMVDEDLEMLDDLDFYNWLQSVPGRSAAGARGEGLG